MRWLGFFALLFLAPCVPKVGSPASLITQERIIGVRADPAEAAPGDLVQYASLVASPSGTVQAQNLSWSLCNLRRPVAENTPVGQACLTGDLPQSAQGAQVSIQTPSFACVNFGPLAPPSKTGTLRPSDPDASVAPEAATTAIRAPAMRAERWICLPSRRFSASGCVVTLRARRC